MDSLVIIKEKIGCVLRFFVLRCDEDLVLTGKHTRRGRN